MKKATHQQTKQHNRDLVLHTIFANESISRAEVARVTNLTRTTVSDVVNGLLEEGLVQEVGRGESIGGKTPILLSVVADARYLIGLNLAQDKFIGGCINIRRKFPEDGFPFLLKGNMYTNVTQAIRCCDSCCR